MPGVPCRGRRRLRSRHPLRNLRQRVLDVLLNGALQGTGAEMLIVAVIDQKVGRALRQAQRELLFAEPFLHVAREDRHDLRDVLPGQRVEDDHVVQPVQELGIEHLVDLFFHLFGHPLEIAARIGLPEAEGLAFGDVARADVRRHDHDGVLEVDQAAVVVRQMPFVEHLQQDVEHIGVCLLDFVEQHHGVRLAPHGLRQRPRIFVAHVSGRRADQPAHRKLLHVLRHVDANQRLRVGEQEARERARQLGFPDARGTTEDEGADRTLGILEAGPAAPDGPRDHLDSLVLADDALVQLVFHP